MSGQSITINNFVIDMMIMIVFISFYIFIIVVLQLYYSIDHLFVMQSVGVITVIQFELL